MEARDLFLKTALLFTYCKDDGGGHIRDHN